MDIQGIDFTQLDPKEIGLWPLPLRILVTIAACLVVAGATFFLLIMPEIEQMESEFKQEDNKRKEFKEKFEKAINLPLYVEQLDNITANYTQQLGLMPPVSNIPGLINNITTIANKYNISIRSIKLGEEKQEDSYYKSMNLDLEMSGTYHNFGRFLADVSQLRRLVTMHSFVLKPQASKEGDPSNDLQLSLVLKTYWQSLGTPDAQENADNTNQRTTNTTAIGAPGQTGAATSSRNDPNQVELEMAPDRAPRSTPPPSAPNIQEGV